MKINFTLTLASGLLPLVMFSCGSMNKNEASSGQSTTASREEAEYGKTVDLQEPFATPSINKYAVIVGWKEGEAPVAPAGYKVVRFAEGLNSPRNIYVAADGRVFVAQSRTEERDQSDDYLNARNIYRSASPDEILVFQDNDADGRADEKKVFLSGLKQPYGMLILNEQFYVANTDGLVRYGYDSKSGELKATTGEKIVQFPAGGYNNHWTRNIISNQTGDKILISIGSGSDVGENGMENEVRRAAILEVNPDGSAEQIFAHGIRNPVGMDIEPHTGHLWTAVNERDKLGDQLVPDYITSVQEGKFYGWPYYYWGMNQEPRWKDSMPDNLPNSLKPDFALGAHTASLGLSFNKIDGFKTGAYIGQHGSWNRSEFEGYKVAFVPFRDGKPAGKIENFLTGFIADKDKKEVHGRPAAVVFTKNYMLVADDAANVIWAVIPESE